MDEFKPEDELKPDSGDRRAGRSRQSSERDSDPQINFDDVDLDEADEHRPTRTRRVREEEYNDSGNEQASSVEHRPRKRQKAPVSKPASRQYIMMGLGIIVLLLLIIGIGSALKAPSAPSSEQASGSGKRIDLSDNTADQANGAQPAPGEAAVDQPHNTDNPAQNISLPPVSSTPTQSQNTTVPEGQQRLEVQGELNNALNQQQGQINGAVANSTLPTEPATVAPVHGGNQRLSANNSERTERKHAVIESRPQSKPQAIVKAEQKPATQPKRPEPPVPAKTPAPAETAKPAATTSAKPVTASGGGKETGNVGALKSAPSSHYTLQLSSSSNYDNLNKWAKKTNLRNYVVYQTTRNGQPWYVLVSGVYATKDDAKRAVSTLPADVQAKNPWAKPVRQVQSELK